MVNQKLKIESQFYSRNYPHNSRTIRDLSYKKQIKVLSKTLNDQFSLKSIYIFLIALEVFHF